MFMPKSRRVKFGLSVVLAVVGGGLWLAGVAFGHAEVVSSTVPQGTVFALAEVPGQVTLTFSEELDRKRSALYVVKLGEDVLVDNGDLFVEENQMTIGLRALDEGVYQVRWIAVTPDDGGFREGTITFAVHF